MAILWSNAREKLERYARHAASFSLIGGFIFDYFTLWRIDLWAEDLIFIVYLCAGALCITYLTMHEAGIVKGKWPNHFHAFCLLTMQFIFGGLFGRFFIFYSRSGALATSWPFLLFLAALIIGNERFRKHYTIFTYRMSVFFVALFSFAIFYVPILADEISVRMFVASGGISLIIMVFFSWGLFRALRFAGRVRPILLVASIGSIFIAINFMYAFNIIPPLPLSLENGGVYHEVRRSNGEYIGSGEIQPWYARFHLYPQIHIAPGESVFAFSSVFAPTHITTTITHEWQYYNTEKSQWATASTIPFTIVGGRDGGYRGFSYKARTQPGRWRVNIKTERGQLIGRIKFEIVSVESRPQLETKALN